MAGFNTGLKKKLTITACTVEKGKVTLSRKAADRFEVMLNPSSYRHEHTIEYNEKKTQGQAGADPKFSAVDAEKIRFDLIIDGTGVVGVPIPGVGPNDVKTQIRLLKDIVYKYRGKEHEPSIVQLSWGKFIFIGRLDSLSLEYTLFMPGGDPLRAKVQMSFTQFMSAQEESLRANRSSPDLSHKVLVKAGDTLPLLCYRIYKDSSYYPQVARFNNLTDFRHIEPGSTLDFPPLRAP